MEYYVRTESGFVVACEDRLDAAVAKTIDMMGEGGEAEDYIVWRENRVIAVISAVDGRGPSIMRLGDHRSMAETLPIKGAGMPVDLGLGQ